LKTHLDKTFIYFRKSMASVQVLTSRYIQTHGEQSFLTVPNLGGLFAITADWCGHCKKLHADVKKAQKITKFDFFYLDGDKDREVMSKLKFNGFPTLFLVDKSGRLQTYGDRPRDARSIATLMSQFIG
jgi:thiol-disulfide isomerase/thioredoxin